jgi:predicted nucleic acid-binding protein
MVDSMKGAMTEKRINLYNPNNRKHYRIRARSSYRCSWRSPSIVSFLNLSKSLWKSEPDIPNQPQTDVSVFCIMELYEHFRDWFLLQRVIGDGFGYREFRRERKNHRLSKKETTILESLVEEFRDNPNIYFIEFESVPSDFFSRVAILQKNGFDCMDAFHLLTAMDVGVTHFVTKDGEVRSRFDKVTRKELVSPPMEMTSIRGFMKLMT